jgi:hypothetical protein
VFDDHNCMPAVNEFIRDPSVELDLPLMNGKKVGILRTLCTKPTARRRCTSRPVAMCVGQSRHAYEYAAHMHAHTRTPTDVPCIHRQRHTHTHILDIHCRSRAQSLCLLGVTRQ